MFYFSLFLGYLTIIIIFICGFFIQEITKNSIFFGVRIPVDYKEYTPLLEIKKEYKKNYSISLIILAAIFTLLILIIPKYSTIILFYCIFICIPVMLINYYITYKKAKLLKNKENWKLDSAKTITIDTSFRKNNSGDKISVSQLWFLIPLFILIITVIILYINYPSIPSKIIKHTDIMGKPDSWNDKSLLSVFSISIVQAVLILLMYFVFKLIKNAKQLINGGDVKNIIYNSKKIRYYTSLLILILTIIISIIFSITSLQFSGIIKQNKTISIIYIILIILTTVLPLFLLLISKKIECKNNSTVNDKSTVINRDDDDNYIMGLFYYNKNDPALFVEKRVGIGYDFNYAKIIAKISVSILTLLIIFLLTFLTIR